MKFDQEEGRLRFGLSARFKKVTQLTAMTLGMVVSVQAFAQEDCEDSGGLDDDCVLDLGTSGGAYDPGYPDPPDFSWYEGGGTGSGGSSSGGSSGGSGSSNGPTPAQCLALEQSKPANCHADPLTNTAGQPINAVNYSSWLTSRLSQINPSVYEYNFQGYLVLRSEFRYLTYPLALNVGHQMSQAYMDTGSYISARGPIWATLANHCQNNVPSNELELCLQEQADFMSTLHPNPTQGGGNWSGGISWGPFSFSISGEQPSGNWVSAFLELVQADKICHLWFQHPDQEGCN